MENLSDKVLRKIKEEKISPKPRWHFLLKDYVVWLIFAASVLIGAVSFCVILFVFLSNDWDLYKFLKVNPLEYFVFLVPYIWLLFLVFFIGVAFYNYKHTKTGYRHETYVIAGLSVLASIVLGFVFHFAFGMGERIDTALSASLPVYSRIHAYCNRENIWSQPERGLLAGEIRQISAGADNFELKDFKGFLWQVEKDEKILVPPNFMIIVGRRVKLIGEKRSERIFFAREIRPWGK